MKKNESNVSLHFETNCTQKKGLLMVTLNDKFYSKISKQEKKKRDRKQKLIRNFIKNDSKIVVVGG